MKNTNLLIPKFLGVVTISAVLIIGVYVLIVDLPAQKKEANMDASNQTAAILEDKNQSKTDMPSSNIEDTTPGTSKENTEQNTANSTAPSSPATPTPPATPTYTYKNGSFTSSMSYKVPGNRTNTLTATISITNDIITTISTSSVNDSGSQQYNDDFKNEIQSAVENKKILGLVIPDGPGDAVGGASLTSEAFNIILNQIRSTAKNS